MPRPAVMGRGGRRDFTAGSRMKNVFAITLVLAAALAPEAMPALRGSSPVRSD